MEKIKSRGFLLRQRAYLKLYLYRSISRNKMYGKQYLNEFLAEFDQFGYTPSHAEIYKTLHEMTLDGHVKRERRIKGDPQTDFQEIIFYTLTEQGKEFYEAYNKSMKVELERCRDLLNKALRDHYGPVK